MLLDFRKRHRLLWIEVVGQAFHCLAQVAQFLQLWYSRVLRVFLRHDGRHLPAPGAQFGEEQVELPCCQLYVVCIVEVRQEDFHLLFSGFQFLLIKWGAVLLLSPPQHPIVHNHTAVSGSVIALHGIPSAIERKALGQLLPESERKGMNRCIQPLEQGTDIQRTAEDGHTSEE